MRAIGPMAVLLAAATSIVVAPRGFTVPLSNVSAATVISEDGSHLDLLVVWRGSPRNIIDVSGAFVLDWIRGGSGAWLIQRATTTPQS